MSAERPDARLDPSDLFCLADAEQRPLETEVVSERMRIGLRGRTLLRELRYTSHEWTGGAVRIAAYLAVPLRREPAAAMVFGAGDMDRSSSLARRHGIACLCFDRPGVGQSTGPEDLYENWIGFDDPRESWMWDYVPAAMRAVTYLRELPEIDPDRIGLTGYSRGGTMAFIANGVDPRIRVAVPQASAGDIVRALDLGGWANYLHTDEAGKPRVPDSFYDFARYYDPILYAGTQHGVVMPIIGAQDEFFPLATVKATTEAMGEGCRLELIPNWDHRYFAGDNSHVDAFDNKRAFRQRTHCWLSAAVRCVLRRDGALPSSPELRTDRSAGSVSARVRVDQPARARRAWLWYSTDGAYLFDGLRLRRDGDGFSGELRLPADAAERGALYAEVEYRGGPFVSSLPTLGPGFEQRIRPFPEEE